LKRSFDGVDTLVILPIWSAGEVEVDMTSKGHLVDIIQLWQIELLEEMVLS